jgi:FlaA1/EpsC-like NDP-sugar epimerase
MTDPTSDQGLTRSLLGLPRFTKQVLAVGLDVVLCAGSLWLALALRLEDLTPAVSAFTTPAVISIAIAIPIFWLMGLYRAVFRHSGGRALRIMAKVVGIYGGLFALVVAVVGIHGVPRSLGITQPMILFLLLGGSRWFIRSWLGGQIARSDSVLAGKVVLIYGAGEAGRQLAANLAASSGWRFSGFLDDDKTLWGATINGSRVHNPTFIAKVVEKYDVNEIWLAMPAVTAARRREIIETVRPLAVYVRTLPTLADLTSGRVRLSDIQELDIHDLLGRDPVEPHGLLLNQTVRGKTVLVTGAGGSIGSELCRQIARLEPARLILVGHSEYALYAIHHELLGTLKKQQASNNLDVDVDVDDARLPFQIVPILASVTEETLMGKVFQRWQPQTVLHAAAFKHVPMVERNVSTAVFNNVWGTYTCAGQAIAAGTQSFVLVSTDKAVRPTNVMGASKRLSELVVQALAASPAAAGRSFAAVRFGNVLGSSGSVVPLFRDQIANGGPVTLTHPEITRYFMTIPEASQLVLQAAGMAKGGEVFVLDMGKPVRVYDLARRMIEFSGLMVKDELNPRGDIEIKVTGLRPGEKIFEELLIGGNPQATSHPKIMKARETFIGLDELENDLGELLQAILRNDAETARRILGQLVPEYSPAKDIVDWAHDPNPERASPAARSPAA